ncbi:Putative E3 ubiquitin-protein ligase SH3RF1 [Chelonia mydas]|uniref:Putative E3 ubiquitin-protein ligase SH3RF1 n=1 Tax=Chelonia mydas TaxID=8469 RepID=M7B9T3_CHEMY|nr:Putative E3 ubiquitin-protein ligase SH3RF1 [Chelonia mydas]
MDESALLDLLECPVCLERLDASAKVLPCQHTFCKRCLLGIVSSRNELRCPECRTLVDCSVDELPSNILLVRLLDGIKQRPWKPGTGGGTSCTNALRAQSSTVASCGSKDPQSSQGGQQQRVQARSPPVRNWAAGEWRLLALKVKPLPTAVQKEGWHVHTLENTCGNIKPGDKSNKENGDDDDG